jgi:hypothetical protein
MFNSTFLFFLQFQTLLINSDEHFRVQCTYHLWTNFSVKLIVFCQPKLSISQKNKENFSLIFSSAALWHVVQRTKQCLDFTCTVHFFHIIICWIYNGYLGNTFRFKSTFNSQNVIIYVNCFAVWYVYISNKG